MSTRLSRKPSERRQLTRFSVVNFRVTSSVVDIVLRDLNSEGMSIESRRQLRVGATYPFRIHEGGASVALDGVVKWCRLRRMIDIGGGESQALYRAGIAFSRIVDDFLPPAKSIPQADAMPASDRNETSSRRSLERKNRKRTQAGLADLVEAFIKDLPPESESITPPERGNT